MHCNPSPLAVHLRPPAPVLVLLARTALFGTVPYFCREFLLIFGHFANLVPYSIVLLKIMWYTPKIVLNCTELFGTFSRIREREDMQHMRQIAVGHDHGNTNTTDYVIEAPPASSLVRLASGVEVPMGTVRHKTTPSMVALGSLDDLALLRTGAGHRGDTSDVEHLVISVNGGPEQVVGLAAMLHKKDASSGIHDVRRYGHERSLATLLANLGSLYPGDEELEAWVITGLPVQTYKKGAQIRQKTKEVLEGDHRYVLNGVERRAVVHVDAVRMEGAGGLIAYGMDGDDVRQAILDIGGRTTDGVATRGMEPIQSKCDGRPIGVENVKDLLSQFVEADAHYNRALFAEETEGVLRAHLRIKAILHILCRKINGIALNTLLSDLSKEQSLVDEVRRKLSELLEIQQQAVLPKDLSTRYQIFGPTIAQASTELFVPGLSMNDLVAHYPTLHARGKPIDPLDLFIWTEQSSRRIGSEVSSFASALWSVGQGGAVASDNAQVLAAGGGTYHFLQDVREIIPEITPCAEPELANSIGYAHDAYAAMLEAMGVMV
jgi:hypothetical protein